MPDPFASSVVVPSAPGRNALPVVPSDTEDLPTVCRSIWVGYAGDVVGIPAGQESPVTFPNVQGVLPVAFRRILETGTGATGIVAIW